MVATRRADERTHVEVNVIKLSRGTSNLKASLPEGGAQRAEGVSQARYMKYMIVAKQLEIMMVTI